MALGECLSSSRKSAPRREHISCITRPPWRVATVILLVIVSLSWAGTLAEAYTNFNVNANKPAFSSTTQSTLTCFPTSATPVVAGSPVYCTLVLKRSGVIIPADADPTTICQLKLAVCTSKVAQQEGTYTIVLNNSTYVSPGTFRFLFYPTYAGTYTLTARTTAPGATGIPRTGNLTVVASSDKDIGASTSECITSGVGNARTCSVVDRDRFGNIIGTKSGTRSFPASEDGLETTGSSVCTLPDDPTP